MPSIGGQRLPSRAGRVDPAQRHRGATRRTSAIGNLSRRAMMEQASRPPDRAAGGVVARVMASIASPAPGGRVQRTKLGIERLFPAGPGVEHKADYIMITGTHAGLTYHIRIDHGASDREPNFHITWENNAFGRRAHFYYNRSGKRSQSASPTEFTAQNGLYKADVTKKGLAPFATLGQASDVIAGTFTTGRLAQALERVEKAKAKMANAAAEQEAVRRGEDTLRIRVQPKPRKGWGSPGQELEKYSKPEMMEIVVRVLGTTGWGRFPGKESEGDVVIRFEHAEDAGLAMTALGDSELKGAVRREASNEPWPWGAQTEGEEELSLAGFFD